MDVLGGEVLINPGPKGEGMRIEHAPHEVRVSGYVPHSGGNVVMHNTVVDTIVKADVKPGDRPQSLGPLPVTREILIDQFLAAPFRDFVVLIRDMKIELSGLEIWEMAEYAADEVLQQVAFQQATEVKELEEPATPSNDEQNLGEGERDNVGE